MDQKLVKWVGWVGVIFSILVLLVFFGLNLNEPGRGASGATVLRYFQSHHDSELASFYVIVAALVVIVFYAAGLASALRAVTEQPTLSSVVVGGAVVFLAASAVGGFAEWSLIAGAKTLSASSAQSMNVLNDADPIGFQVGGLIMGLAAGLAILSRPRAAGRGLMWLGIVSIIVGVAVAATPAGLLLFVIWVPVTGFVVSHAVGRTVGRTGNVDASSDAVAARSTTTQTV
jgi:hypothetical protein